MSRDAGCGVPRHAQRDGVRLNTRLRKYATSKLYRVGFKPHGTDFYGLWYMDYLHFFQIKV